MPALAVTQGCRQRALLLQLHRPPSLRGEWRAWRVAQWRRRSYARLYFCATMLACTASSVASEVVPVTLRRQWAREGARVRVCAAQWSEGRGRLAAGGKREKPLCTHM